MERVSSNLPDGYTAKDKAIADREHRSLANWIARLLIDAVDQDEQS
jgi:hypothetical protein